MNTYPIKNYLAEGAIDRYTIVKPGTDGDQVTAAAGNTDALIGVADAVDIEDGNDIDIYHSGLHQVKLGGAVSRGDQLTSDASAKAVTAAPAAGDNNNVIGTALADGVADDVIPVVLAISTVQG